MKSIINKRTMALLGLLAVSAGSCSAATSLIDTIGTGADYQVGRVLSRTVQVGWDKYPWSGDFTADRPVFDLIREDGVCELGTSGVPVAEGNAQWIAQPFMPKQSGYVVSVDFVAQYMQTVGEYADGYTPGTAVYVDIVPAPVDGQLVSLPNPKAIDLASAKRGKIMGSGEFGMQVTAGQWYWLVFAATDTVGQWGTGGLDYANLNWTPKSIVPDNSYVQDVKINTSNGSGVFSAFNGSVVRFRMKGYASAPAPKSISEAKGLSVGDAVSISNVVLAGKGGALGNDFYVENADRSSGIRVTGQATAIAAKQYVNVVGEVTLVGTEKAIDITVGSCKDTLVSKPDFEPVLMTIKGVKAIGGGLDTTGLLVKVTGDVKSFSGATFVISDGSDDAGITCKGVAGWSNLPTSATGRRSVVGEVSIEGGNKVILIRSNGDIQL